MRKHPFRITTSMPLDLAREHLMALHESPRSAWAAIVGSWGARTTVAVQPNELGVAVRLNREGNRESIASLRGQLSSENDHTVFAGFARVSVQTTVVLWGICGLLGIGCLLAAGLTPDIPTSARLGIASVSLVALVVGLFLYARAIRHREVLLAACRDTLAAVDGGGSDSLGGHAAG